MKNRIRMLLFAVILGFLVLPSVGCVKTMGDTEYGEVWRKLPKSLGGGYLNRVEPGTWIFYNPMWTDVFVISTKQKTITWAGKGHGDNPEVNDALNTRAADGNETWLTITAQYHISPKMTREVLLNIGADEEDYEEAVEAYARSKIRARLGELATDAFYDNTLRYQKTGNAKTDLNERLNPYGIIIDNVNLDSHNFAPNYQEKIDDTKKVEQDAQQKNNEIATVETDKKKEYQDVVGITNGWVADALGKENQAISRGDGYYSEKNNEAAAISAEGENAAAAIIKKIESLRKAGGESVVRLEIGKQIMGSGALFYLVNRGSGSSEGNLDMSKIDYNEFLGQIGKMSLSGENISSVEQRRLKP